MEVNFILSTFSAEKMQSLLYIMIHRSIIQKLTLRLLLRKQQKDYILNKSGGKWPLYRCIEF